MKGNLNVKGLVSGNPEKRPTAVALALKAAVDKRDARS